MENKNIYKLENDKNNMVERRWTFWDYLIFLGIILILGWALLKSLGIIHSPIWLDMIPYYGMGIAALGGSYKLGKIMEGIERLLKIEERFNKLENTHNLCIEGKLDKSPYKKS